MKKYPAQAIRVIRTKEGGRSPIHPCGMAVPKGFELSYDGSEYIKHNGDEEASLIELLKQ